jgi:hypothetical protein
MQTAAAPGSCGSIVVKRLLTWTFVILGVLTIAALAAGLYLLKDKRTVQEAYDRASAYFAGVGEKSAPLSGTYHPGNDLRALLEAGYGRELLVRLDQASDWVAYDGRRNTVYFLTSRLHDNKIKLHQWSMEPKCFASKGFTHQVVLEKVGFEGDSLVVRLRVADELPKKYGMIVGETYVVAIADPNRTFLLSDWDHDEFLASAKQP